MSNLNTTHTQVGAVVPAQINSIKISNRLGDLLRDNYVTVNKRTGDEKQEYSFNVHVWTNILFECPAPAFGNYFDVRDSGQDGKITYHAHPEKQVIKENGKWGREGRQELKVYKLIEYLYFASKVTVSERYPDVTDTDIIKALSDLICRRLKGLETSEIQESHDSNSIYKLPSR